VHYISTKNIDQMAIPWQSAFGLTQNAICCRKKLIFIIFDDLTNNAFMQIMSKVIYSESVADHEMLSLLNVASV